MMLGLMGQPTTVDLFLYTLAQRLHKTVHELQQVPHREILEWAAYFKAKAALEKTEDGSPEQWFKNP